MALCKREGCTNNRIARGLCNSHYAEWRRKVIKVTGQILGRGDEEQRLLDAMPGTYLELGARCGVSESGVRKVINRLHAAGRTHVKKIRPPLAGIAGARWQKIFAAGPGKDATVSEKAKYAHRLESRRNWWASTRPPKAAPPPEPAQIAWLGVSTWTPNHSRDPLVALFFGASK